MLLYPVEIDFESLKLTPMRRIFELINNKLDKILFKIRPFRYRIFNKVNIDYGIYSRALRMAERSRDPELRSIAINLRSDNRISENRELEFREYFKRTGRDLKKAVIDYHDEAVVKNNNPAFCNQRVAEFTNGNSVCSTGFNPDLQLASVLTFHKLRERIMNIDELSIESDLWDVGLVTARTDSELFSSWLDGQLLGNDGSPKSPNSPNVHKFIKDIFELANYDLYDTTGAYNENSRVKPLWVTDWDLFSEYTSQPADRWNQVVGVWRTFPTWQIVITYPAKDVDFLYRPTQLDGGYYPQHFPPPPDIEDGHGGYTMDWGTTDEILLPELIHKQIELKFEYWVNAGSLLAKTTDLSCDLKTSRSRHYEKLGRFFNPGKLAAWMRHPF